MKIILPFLFLFALTFSSWKVTKAQSYHFQIGFGSYPEGWTLNNTYLTSTSENVHNEFEGSKSVKMKGTESTIVTSGYATTGELSYWVRPMISGSKLKVDKSIDTGTSWIELESFNPQDNDLTVYQKRIITINDPSSSVIIRFTATGGVDQNDLMYLDDVSPSSYAATTSAVDYDNPDFIIYPNPVLNFKYLCKKRLHKSISLVNLLGQKVYNSTNTEKTLSINMTDMTDMTEGLYLLYVESGQGISIKKVI